MPWLSRRSRLCRAPLLDARRDWRSSLSDPLPLLPNTQTRQIGMPKHIAIHLLIAQVVVLSVECCQQTSLPQLVYRNLSC